jgi:hypothetical protein
MSKTGAGDPARRADRDGKLDSKLVAQVLKISSAYSPPPREGFVSPMTWGIETNVMERFAAAGVPKENISFLRDTYTLNFPGPLRNAATNSENIMVQR